MQPSEIKVGSLYLCLTANTVTPGKTHYRWWAYNWNDSYVHRIMEDDVVMLLDTDSSACAMTEIDDLSSTEQKKKPFSFIWLTRPRETVALLCNDTIYLTDKAHFKLCYKLLYKKDM